MPPAGAMSAPSAAPSAATTAGGARNRGALRRAPRRARPLPGDHRAQAATIGIYHKASGVDPPTAHGVVRDVERGYRRKLGVAQQQKTALVRDPLLSVLAPIPGDLRGLRDRAIILVGWAAALRRSELAGLELRDLGFEREGVVLAIRRSKRDQEGEGEEVAVAFAAELEQCAVRTLQGWLGAVALVEGPVFRSIDRHSTVGPNFSPWAIGEVVKARVAAAGLAGDFGAHSLRSGFATAGRASRSRGATSALATAGTKASACSNAWLRLVSRSAFPGHQAYTLTRLACLSRTPSQTRKSNKVGGI